VPKLNKALSHKLQVLREALAEQFGTAAEFGDPPGGIYLWIKLPDNVDTVKLGQGGAGRRRGRTTRPEWSVDKEYAARPALCSPPPRTRRSGSGVGGCWPEGCRREFRLPSPAQ
jgi:2-aminoadipate transaminase